MANQQLYPSASYPGSGDIQTSPGSPQTTVVGIQTVPFSNTLPLPSQVPVFNGVEWAPSSTTSTQANQSILVNGVVYSDDYWLFANRKDTEVQVNSAFAPNGFPILAAGTPVNTP